MSARKVRRARVDDVHRVAMAMPHVTVEGDADHPVYQVGHKSFIFFRTPRPDAIDPVSGDRLDDVIVFWVESQDEKAAVLAQGAPYFTTPHFQGHPSVLVRASQLGQLGVEEVEELVQSAWLSRASPTRARAWCAEHGLTL